MESQLTLWDFVIISYTVSMILSRAYYIAKRYKPESKNLPDSGGIDRRPKDK